MEISEAARSAQNCPLIRSGMVDGW